MQNGEKDASKTYAKPTGVLCAVLPYILIQKSPSFNLFLRRIFCNFVVLAKIVFKRFGFLYRNIAAANIGKRRGKPVSLF